MSTERKRILAGYRNEQRALGRRQTAVACMIAAVIVPAFAVYDYVILPANFGSLLVARAACFSLIVAILLLLRTSFGQRRAEWLVVTLGTGVGLAICAVPVYILGYDSTYFTSAIILVATMALLLLWSAAQVLVVSAEICAMYVGAALLHGEITDPALFVGQISAIAATGALATVSVRVRDRLGLSEFIARRGLETASAEKSRLIAELEQQTARLQQLNQDMEDVLYVASHDLRAPLINVQGFAREIAIGLEDLKSLESGDARAAGIHADLKESMRFILAAVQRMDGLIQSLLSISRIGTRTNPSAPVPLQSMVEQVIESFRYQLDQGRINVQVSELPVVVGDPTRLNQVFSNLVDNAIKYMSESPERRIEIGSRNGRGPTRFFVRDSGPGIAPEDQENVFRLFRRLANGVPGEGLGLSMVRRIVEKHGGRIWIESKPGEGSTFWFTLTGADADYAVSEATPARED